jgi:transcriptional regulator GlxA family with amidase domain
VDAPLEAAPAALGPLLDWAREAIGDGITVDDLASRGAMSVRTLNRRFRSTVGVPPGEWLQRERLRLAQRLLERTDEPIGAVSRRAGYDSPATMRAQFAARLHTSPRGYRDTFRGRPRAVA